MHRKRSLFCYKGKKKVLFFSEKVSFIQVKLYTKVHKSWVQNRAKAAQKGTSVIENQGPDSRKPSHRRKS